MKPLKDNNKLLVTSGLNQCVWNGTGGWKVASAEAGVLIKMLLEVNKSSAQLQSGGIISSVGRGSGCQEDNASICKLLIKLHKPRGVCKPKSQESRLRRLWSHLCFKRQEPFRLNLIFFNWKSVLMAFIVEKLSRICLWIWKDCLLFLVQLVAYSSFIIPFQICRIFSR